TPSATSPFASPGTTLGWDGRVRAAPRLNGACLKLKRIAESGDATAEEAAAGKSLSELPQAKWASLCGRAGGAPRVLPLHRSAPGHVEPVLGRGWGARVDARGSGARSDAAGGERGRRRPWPA